MDDLNFENFTKSLQTKAPQGMDGDFQIKKMLKGMKPEQLWLIKSISDRQMKFAIGVLGLTYEDAIKTMRLYADMLERTVKICEEKF